MQKKVELYVVRAIGQFQKQFATITAVKGGHVKQCIVQRNDGRRHGRRS